MNVTSERQRVGAVSRAVVRAMVDDAAAHGYGPAHRDAARVLGIVGDPAGTEAGTFEYDGTAVTVRPCVSVLAVRTALLAHTEPGWLVLVTDRSETDLGAGVLAHLAGNKLRTPDPWEALRQQFAATGIESSFYATQSWTFALGLLAARPEGGWPPAPAGTLTRDHALGVVARERLGVPDRSLDALGVLRWTAGPDVPARLASLRQDAGDEVAEATLAWICAPAGAAAAPVGELIRRGEMGDVLPLGLVIAVLTDAAGADHHAAELGLARLAHRWGGQALPEQALAAWGSAATTVAGDLVGEGQHAAATQQLLTRADLLLAEADATGLATHSRILPSGLAARLRSLARALGNAVGSGRLTEVDHAWQDVCDHRLAGEGRVLPAVRAGVRLARWLHSSRPEDTSLAALAQRQASDGAWVDSAVNDAYTGVTDPVVAEALGGVLRAVQVVKDDQDRAFASALARATSDEDGAAEGYLDSGGQRVWLLEHVLRGVVVPLARQAPTLLLVLDGMSTGVATEVMQDLRTGGTWVEALLPGAEQRSCALAALPSLTEVSRTSLLSGTLTAGGQNVERAGYTELTSALGITSTLFHKKPLDTSRAGFALADDVAAAIGDIDGQALVTCILNTIDDALDRSDPGGTSWTTDAVKHLRPLLDQALLAGRTVVLTADHGHVVERREGRQHSHADISSARSRSNTPAAGSGEVLVAGQRVHGGSAVLAVDERLRYGPLKAGYHGGANPSEVVVPLLVLTPGNQVDRLQLAPSQKPTWWEPSAAPTRDQPTGSLDGAAPDMLFDLGTPTEGAPAVDIPVALSSTVRASGVYRAQREIGRRVSLTDEQVAAGIDALVAAPGTRLTEDALAEVLAVPPSRMRGAMAQLQQLLNVEGYPVIRTEPEAVILDEQLLREQFEVG